MIHETSVVKKIHLPLTSMADAKKKRLQYLTNLFTLKYFQGLPRVNWKGQLTFGLPELTDKERKALYDEMMV